MNGIAFEIEGYIARFRRGKCGYLHNFYWWRRKKLCEKN